MQDSRSGARAQPGTVARPANLPTFRAAYSDRTAALMAHLAEFAYDPNIEAKPPVLAPELARLGFTELWAFHNGMTNGWAYIARSPDLIVVSFRGTKTAQDWETNFEVHLEHPPGTDDKLLVHAGFYNAFKGLAGDGLSDRLKEIKKGNIPIYITGHSLGGALAQIASAVLGDDQVAACYTFGSPRVGNAYFDLWVKVPSYRLINHADIVPQVPLPLPLLFRYRHSGDPRYLREPVGESVYRYEPGHLARLWQLGQGIVQWYKAGSILGVADHSIIGYARKLDEIGAKRAQNR
ncbi:MAG: lipase family protein [Methylocella sp.]